jgi:hypothetical protein
LRARAWRRLAGHGRCAKDPSQGQATRSHAQMRASRKGGKESKSG